MIDSEYSRYNKMLPCMLPPTISLVHPTVSHYTITHTSTSRYHKQILSPHWLFFGFISGPFCRLWGYGIGPCDASSSLSTCSSVSVN